MLGLVAPAEALVVRCREAREMVCEVLAAPAWPNQAVTAPDYPEGYMGWPDPPFSEGGRVVGPGWRGARADRQRRPVSMPCRYTGGSPYRLNAHIVRRSLEGSISGKVRPPHHLLGTPGGILSRMVRSL